MLDVFHFCDHDMAELFGVEHRVIVPKRRSDRVGVS
jgi:hypothetical protein